MLASDNVGSAQLTDNAAIDYEIRHVYSKKMAKKNTKALSLGAKELLLPLVDVLFECTSETREHLQVDIAYQLI